MKLPNTLPEEVTDLQEALEELDVRSKTDASKVFSLLTYTHPNARGEFTGAGSLYAMLQRYKDISERYEKCVELLETDPGQAWKDGMNALGLHHDAFYMENEAIVKHLEGMGFSTPEAEMANIDHYLSSKLVNPQEYEFPGQIEQYREDYYNFLLSRAKVHKLPPRNTIAYALVSMAIWSLKLVTWATKHAGESGMLEEIEEDELKGYINPFESQSGVPPQLQIIMRAASQVTGAMMHLMMMLTHQSAGNLDTIIKNLPNTPMAAFCTFTSHVMQTLRGSDPGYDDFNGEEESWG